MTSISKSWSADPGAPVLSVSDLRVAANGGDDIVKGVSFDIHAGECLAVVGESGSGKSLTAMASLGLLDYMPGIDVGGSVRVEGREMNGAAEETWREVRGAVMGMIFQDPQSSLNPALSVGAQVAEVIRAHRNLSNADIEREVVRLLDSVGIADAARRSQAYPHEFSGGMRQRAMIAIALAGEPSLLIADEPTTALDVTVQAQLLDLLRSLQESRKLAMLFISHDLGVVADIADRVSVMLNGEFVETGRAADIFANPQHSYTQRLLAASREFGGLTEEPELEAVRGEND